MLKFNNAIPDGPRIQGKRRQKSGTILPEFNENFLLRFNSAVEFKLEAINRQKHTNKRAHYRQNFI